MFAPGTTPSPPTSPAHRSLITSPNRFSITSTSNRVGSQDQLQAHVVDRLLLELDERELVGHLAGALAGTGRRDSRITSALWQKVTCRRPWWRASSKA